MWTGFTLRHPLPRRPASYGWVRSLTITPSCPDSIARSRKRSASATSAGDDRRQSRRLGHRCCEHVAPHRKRLVVDRNAIGQQHVEEEGIERRCHAHRVLERLGRAVVHHAHRLAVEDEVAAGHRPHDLGHLGEAGGDVVEVPGEQAHLTTEPVRLHTGAVELPVDLSRPASSRRERSPTSPRRRRPPGSQASVARVEVARGRSRRAPTAHRSAQQRRRRRGHPPSSRRGARHRPGHRQPSRSRSSARRRVRPAAVRPTGCRGATAARRRSPRRAAAPAHPAGGLHPVATQCLDRSQRPIDVEHAQRGDLGGRRRDARHRRPPHTDPAQRRGPDEKGHRRLDLVGRQHAGACRPGVRPSRCVSSSPQRQTRPGRVRRSSTVRVSQLRLRRRCALLSRSRQGE